MTDTSGIKFNCDSCGKSYRVPIALAGRSAKCKGCGAKMRVPRPSAAAEADEEVFSIDDLQAMGDQPASAEPEPVKEVFSLDDLAALAGEPEPNAAPAVGQAGMLSAAPFAFQAATPTAATTRPRAKQPGLFASMRGMWLAFTTVPEKSGQRLPRARYVSMGGLFLIIGAIQLILFSGLHVSPAELAEADKMTPGSPSMSIWPSSSKISFGMILLGIPFGLAGCAMMGRRMLMPRQTPESPVVLVVFYISTAVLLLGSFFVVIGGGESAKAVAQMGIMSLFLAEAAFGVWMLKRITADYDATAFMLILTPAIIIPLSIFCSALAQVDHPQFPWTIFFVSMLALVVVLILMGGAVSFIALLLSPFLFLWLLGTGIFGGAAGIAGVMIVGMCLMCYLVFVIWRWSLIFKPVAWQFCILVLGGTLMYHFYAYSIDLDFIAQAKQSASERDDKLTKQMQDAGFCPPGVTASYEPFSNSKTPGSIPDGAEVVYLSNGAVLIDPYDKVEKDTTPDRIVTRPVRPVQTPPQPMFTSLMLPGGTKDVPGKGEDWPTFDQPDIAVKPNNAVAFWGYTMKLMPGYRVGSMSENSENGSRTVRIVGPGTEQPSEAIVLILSRQDFRANELPIQMQLESMLRDQDVDKDDDYIDFGQISTIPFARGAPSDKERQSYRKKIIYVSPMPELRRRIIIHIPLNDRSDDEVLASEAMVRTLEQTPIKMGQAVPDQDVKLDSALVPYSSETLGKTRWNVAGIFATPGGLSMYGRVDDDRPEGLGISYSISGSKGNIDIDFVPIMQGLSPTYRVQAQGPEPIRQDDTFTGRTLYAFGGHVNYVRLWEDELFVRIERGVSSTSRGEESEVVTYHGTLGGHWVTLTLSRHPDKGLPIGELEAMLKQVRLATPLELSKDFRHEQWVARLIRAGDAGLPLYGGTTIAEAFEISSLGKAELSSSVDPDTGLFVRVYPPLAEADLAPYKQWSAFEETQKMLGKEEQIGSILIRPIAELKRSAKSDNQRVEWFYNTGSGRFSITLNIETLDADDKPIAIPVRTDPDTGKTLLDIGKRTLTVDGEVSVTYRESRGLRVWRILMPQVGGASLRRCYYVAEMPGQRLTISADFERDQALQLQAIDTSMATLIYKPRPKVE